MSGEYFLKHILWRVVVTLLMLLALHVLQGIGIIAGLGMIGVLGVLWAGPLATAVGGATGGLWLPSDDNFEVRPQYSIAEARLREGQYEEAIEVYRKYMELYPNEVTPHLRIADLQLVPFNNPDAAMEELKQAIHKSQTVETFSQIHFRLAELYVTHGNRVSDALHSMREIQRCYPKTKQASVALERAGNLLKLQQS